MFRIWYTSKYSNLPISCTESRFTSKYISVAFHQIMSYFPNDHSVIWPGPFCKYYTLQGKQIWKLFQIKTKQSKFCLLSKNNFIFGSAWEILRENSDHLIFQNVPRTRHKRQFRWSSKVSLKFQFPLFIKMMVWFSKIMNFD